MKWNDIPQFITHGSWECDYSLVSFIKFIEENEREYGLQMNPDFQRGHIWTEEQQVKYLEFLLRGGKTARVIYLNSNHWQTNCDDPEYFVCVDGLQRYTAIKRFVDNEIKVFGHYFNEFEGNPRSHLHGIKVNINNLQTRKEVLQWYIEFNTGGTIHSKEEIDRVKELLKQEEMK